MEAENTTTADAKVDVIMEDNNDAEEENFVWTPIAVLQSVAIFCMAGVAEIMGGWLVWVAVRGHRDGKKPWWYAAIGSFVLVIYGFIPCFQPTDSFGRVYAVYGGFFIVLSFLFGWGLDGDKPDLGDLVGCCVALVGVFIIMFWPR